MLAAPMLFQHTFTLHFPRVNSVRRASNDLEDCLNAGCPGGYNPPQLVPMPDEFSPDVPRIIFNSVNGYSTISVSQTSMALSVNYSEDWQADRVRCVQYLKRRVHVVFDMLSKIEVAAIFAGVGTGLRSLSDSNNDQETISAIRGLLSPEFETQDPNEILIRVSNSLSGRYFSNLTVTNTTQWHPEDFLSGRFSRDRRLAVGIEITGDFNNRLAYNENDGAAATLDESLVMIDQATDAVFGLARRFGETYA